MMAANAAATPAAPLGDQPAAPRGDPFVSIVTPVLNEAMHIGAFIEALEDTLTDLQLPFEIIVVDDGSRDDSGQRAFDASRHQAVRVIRFSRNFGKEAAMTAGLEFATGDVTILIDSDFQHPVSLIGAFIDKWRQGYDMVYGVRDSRDDEPWWKRSSTAVFYKYIGDEEGISLPVNAGDFRLLDRKAVEAINRFSERDRMMKGLFAWLGFRSIGIPYHVGARASGSSHYSVRRLARLATTGVTSFSTMPLKAIGVLGLLVSAGAFLYGISIIVETVLKGFDVPGWPTLVCAMMFFGGLQLLSISVLGTYIGRIYREVKARPLFIIDETLGFERPQRPAERARARDSQNA